MTSVTQLVEALVSQVDNYINGILTDDQLEQYTMGIIAHDDFDELPDGLQDAIYTLDNKELNNLSNQDVLKIKEEIQRLMS